MTALHICFQDFKVQRPRLGGRSRARGLGPLPRRLCVEGTPCRLLAGRGWDAQAQTGQGGVRLSCFKLHESSAPCHPQSLKCLLTVVRASWAPSGSQLRVGEGERGL